MRLTDIIRCNHQITEGKSQLFIAETNFLYKGLPILKDSLVYFDGLSEIRVNMIGFGIFQEKNIPDLISDYLPKDDDNNYLVEKVSNCKNEIYKLRSSARGIWHN